MPSSNVNNASTVSSIKGKSLKVAGDLNNNKPTATAKGKAPFLSVSTRAGRAEERLALMEEESIWWQKFKEERAAANVPAVAEATNTSAQENTAADEPVDVEEEETIAAVN